METVFHTHVTAVRQWQFDAERRSLERHSLERRSLGTAEDNGQSKGHCGPLQEESPGDDAAQQQLDQLHHKLLQDCTTRWNSQVCVKL